MTCLSTHSLNFLLNIKMPPLNIQPENSYAVVIGINDYKERGPKFGYLPNLENHAINVVKWLHQSDVPYQNIWLLLTPSNEVSYDDVKDICKLKTAQLENIRSTFSEIGEIESNGERKLLFIYLLGHGGKIGLHDALFCAEKGYILSLQILKQHFFGLKQEKAFEQFVIFADMCRDLSLREYHEEVKLVLKELSEIKEVGMTVEHLMAVPEYYRAWYSKGASFSSFLLEVLNDRNRTFWLPTIDAIYEKLAPKCHKSLGVAPERSISRTLPLPDIIDSNSIEYKPAENAKFFLGNDIFFFVGYNDYIDYGYSKGGKYINTIRRDGRTFHHGNLNEHHLFLIIKEEQQQRLIKTVIDSKEEKELYKAERGMTLSAPLIYEGKIYLVESKLAANSEFNLIIVDPKKLNVENKVPYTKNFLGYCTDAPIIVNNQICLRWVVDSVKRITLLDISNKEIKMLYGDDNEAIVWSKLATDKKVIFFVEYQQRENPDESSSHLRTLGTEGGFIGQRHKLKKDTTTAKKVYNSPLVVNNVVNNRVYIYISTSNGYLHVYCLPTLHCVRREELGKMEENVEITVEVDMIPTDTKIIVLTNQEYRMHDLMK